MRRAGVVFATAAACTAMLGCGGGGARQDADEPAGEYRLDVKRASFPSEQRLASRATMAIEVSNPADVRVPNVAVTIETEAEPGGEAPLAFGRRVADTTLADPGRPVWIVDRAPRGGDTAYTNTWALGALEPNETKRFVWRVTAVQPGSYTIGYRVSPGLDGKARLADDSSRAKGTFRVTIDDSPVEARVGDNGEVIRE
jgi:hypothetical protein